jgi:hypothetical protein
VEAVEVVVLILHHQDLVQDQILHVSVILVLLIQNITKKKHIAKKVKKIVTSTNQKMNVTHVRQLNAKSIVKSIVKKMITIMMTIMVKNIQLLLLHQVLLLHPLFCLPPGCQ